MCQWELEVRDFATFFVASIIKTEKKIIRMRYKTDG